MEIKRQQLKLLRERERHFSSVIESTLGRSDEEGTAHGDDDDDRAEENQGDTLIRAENNNESRHSDAPSQEMDNDGDRVKPHRMIDVSIQTEDRPLDKVPNTASFKYHTSYDVGVQTDSLLFGVDDGKNSLREKLGTMDEVNGDTVLPDPNSNLLETVKDTTLTEPLKPLVIENEKNSVQFKTFAMEAAIFSTNTQPQSKTHLTTATTLKSSSSSYYTIIHNWSCPITLKDNNNSNGLNSNCVSIDHDSKNNYSIIVFQSRPNTNTTNTLSISTKTRTNTVSVSHVFVLDVDTGQIIDQLEFLGQLVTRCKVLTRAGFGDDSGILSMLLVTSRGKTILYELRRRRNGGESDGEEADELWDRNLMFRNYNSGNGGIFTLCENRLRLICGGSDGAINVLNSLDLSGYEGVASVGSDEFAGSALLDASGAMGDLSRVELVPPEIGDFIKMFDMGMVGEEEEEQERKSIATADGIRKIQNARDKQRRRSAYGEYISRLSLWGEIGISAIAVSPFDEDCLFIGCQDGGIYKVFLRDIKESKLKLSSTNNGFLPDLQSEADEDLIALGNKEEKEGTGKEEEEEEQEEQVSNVDPSTTSNSNRTRQQIRNRRNTLNHQSIATLFHTAPVTSLSVLEEGLLLSSSLDWTCILWDIRHNSRLCSIDLGFPVLQACWLNPKKEETKTKKERQVYRCCALTWWQFCIIEFHLERVPDTKWQCGTPAEIVCSIDQTELTFTKFTNFKLIAETDDSSLSIALGGDTGEVAYVEFRL